MCRQFRQPLWSVRWTRRRSWRCFLLTKSIRRYLVIRFRLRLFRRRSSLLFYWCSQKLRALSEQTSSWAFALEEPVYREVGIVLKLTCNHCVYHAWRFNDVSPFSIRSMAKVNAQKLLSRVTTLGVSHSVHLNTAINELQLPSQMRCMGRAADVLRHFLIS